MTDAKIEAIVYPEGKTPAFETLHNGPGGGPQGNEYIGIFVPGSSGVGPIRITDLKVFVQGDMTIDNTVTYTDVGVG